MVTLVDGSSRFIHPSSMRDKIFETPPFDFATPLTKSLQLAIIKTPKDLCKIGNNECVLPKIYGWNGSLAIYSDARDDSLCINGEITAWNVIQKCKKNISAIICKIIY